MSQELQPLLKERTNRGATGQCPLRFTNHKQRNPDPLLKSLKLTWRPWHHYSHLYLNPLQAETRVDPQDNMPNGRHYQCPARRGHSKCMILRGQMPHRQYTIYTPTTSSTHTTLRQRRTDKTRLQASYLPLSPAVGPERGGQEPQRVFRHPALCKARFSSLFLFCWSLRLPKRSGRQSEAAPSRP